MHPRTQELLQYLDNQRALLRSAYEAVPPSLREIAPAPGRWSPSEVVEHLSIVERRISILLSKQIAAARTAGLAAEISTEPVLPTIDVSHVFDRTTRVNAPETALPTGLDGVSAWAALEDATVSMRKMIMTGDGLALSLVSHPHPRFGPMSVYHWIAFMGAHGARHAAQIRETIKS